MSNTQENLCFFEELAPGRFRANDPARGPWSPNHCHAGPVTGLIARALERAAPDRMMTRITLDLLRATPMDEIQISAKLVHEGRTVAMGSAELRDAEGRLCVAATSMHLTREDIGDPPTAPESVPTFEGVIDGGGRPLKGKAHDLPTFGSFIETAYQPEFDRAAGPKTIWMRTPPLLADETPSPIQALCPLADCGNGISYNAPLGEWSFVNTDLTIQIHREPRSDWLAADSLSHWRGDGVAMSQTTLFDRFGPVGVALQSIVLRHLKK